LNFTGKEEGKIDFHLSEKRREGETGFISPQKGGKMASPMEKKRKRGGILPTISEQ